MESIKKLSTKTIARFAIILFLILIIQENTFAQKPDIEVPGGGTISHSVGPTTQVDPVIAEIVTGGEIKGIVLFVERFIDGIIKIIYITPEGIIRAGIFSFEQPL
ncbi:MAG: hypothetical protein JKY33_00540 [Bacteroidia bacterium]|nr:hypothetical protein [Bacteroidia bacterium]